MLHSNGTGTIGIIKYSIAIASTAVVVVVFGYSLLAKHLELDHIATYKPRYPGDTVQIALMEAKIEFETKLLQNRDYFEARFDKIDKAIEELKSAVGKLTTEQAVEKAIREKSD